MEHADPSHPRYGGFENARGVGEAVWLDPPIDPKVDGRHREMQKKLVADDVYRNLLFQATSPVCSPDGRCQTCHHHSEVILALHRRAEEVLG